MNPTKTTFRILTKDMKIKYTGTDSGSWFTLSEAQKLVDRDKGESIYQYSSDYQHRLFEVL
jgi:hypothetical protein